MISKVLGFFLLLAAILLADPSRFAHGREHDSQAVQPTVFRLESWTPPERRFLPHRYGDSQYFSTEEEAEEHALSLCQADRDNPLSPFGCEIFVN
jgi:hypothetical protein